MGACKEELSTVDWAPEVSGVAERRTARVLAWEGPDPVRVDVAHVTLAPDRLTARGTSAVADYVVDWVLETGPAWVTRTLSVRTRGDGFARSLELGRADDGTWSATRRQDGEPAARLGPVDVALLVASASRHHRGRELRPARRAIGDVAREPDLMETAHRWWSSQTLSCRWCRTACPSPRATFCRT